MTDDFAKDYRNALETLLMQIKTIFESNLEQYSLNMKAMMEDKEAMMKLGGRISDAANSLLSCQDSLNEIIWREIVMINKDRYFRKWNIKKRIHCDGY